MWCLGDGFYVWPTYWNMVKQTFLTSTWPNLRLYIEATKLRNVSLYLFHTLSLSLGGRPDLGDLDDEEDSDDEQLPGLE